MLKDKKMTAENLIGKKVVDRDGREVGTVKDIGLGSAMHGYDRDANPTYGTTSTASTPNYGSTSSTSRTTTADASRTRSSDATSRTGTTTATTTAGAMADHSSYQQMQPTLYVELDGDLDVKDDHLAAIPVSHVRFDSDKKQLKMQLARSELSSQLKKNDSAYNR